MAQDLEILYQDDYIVAVNKPAGHLVHPAEQPQPDDLVAMKIVRDQTGHRVHSIHRIDRPTSGVLLFGIDHEVSRSLHKAFETRDVIKTYLAVTDGHPTDSNWKCTEPIRKHDDAQMRDALTHFQLRKSYERTLGDETLKMALIEAIPHTGRFHQIRRHLLHADLPIIGDYRYAGIERCDHLCALLGIGTRMLLQAYQLELTHPATQEKLTIQAPLDPMISHALGGAIY